MQQVFDDTLFVHYGFVVLAPADGEDPDLDESRRGQTNGLLGAGVEGSLSVMIGTQSGGVPVRIEWYDGEPALTDEWDDVVEASVEVTARDTRLSSFGDTRLVTLPALGSHRARLCATGMDAARQDRGDEGQPPPDRYLLQFWPAEPVTDMIIRVGTGTAQYWHDHAQQLSAPGDDEWAEPATEQGTWSPAIGRGLSEREIVDDVPVEVRGALRAPLARLACQATGISTTYPIPAALDAVANYKDLPDELGSAEEIAGHVESQASPGDDEWDQPPQRSGAILSAVRAVFAAADPNSAADLLPLLEYAKLATGRPGEDLVAQACAELGYA